MKHKDRATTLALWFAHHTYAPIVPLALIGALHMVYVTPSDLMMGLAAIATLVAAAMTIIGNMAHLPLDDAGVPCPHCDLDFEET